MANVSMEEIVSLAKRRGFIYPGSEIYGGLSGTYDFGPLGVALKNNIKNLWWKRFVTDREDMYGIDAAILMNPKAWEASGHVAGFSDPSVKCLDCGKIFRVDQIEEFNNKDFQVVQKEYEKKIIGIIEKDIYPQVDQKFDAAESKDEKANHILNVLESEKPDKDQSKVLLALANKLLQESRKLINEGKEEIEFAKGLKKILKASGKYLGRITQVYLNRLIDCPNCSKRNWSMPEQFNMMFKTFIGPTSHEEVQAEEPMIGGDELSGPVVEGVIPERHLIEYDPESISYLRPETAGGMFVNFKNVVDSFHPKLPFGLAQIGKAFRNEIAPRDFVFRVREFEQMEVEYFVHPSSWEGAFEEWHGIMHAFAKEIGIKKENLHDVEIAPEDRAHYSKRTIDFEFEYPFGQKELWGLAYRTDFDLSAHETTSGVELKYLDEETKEKITPHVIEPSLGVDRTVLAVLLSAYEEDELGGEKRIVLRLPKAIAPYRACVSPLLKNKPELVAKAREVFMMLKKAGISVAYDDNGNIGKRYRRQDEIGTPSCIVIDFDTLGEKPEHLDTVTIRDRDTGEQERLAISELVAKLTA